MNKIVKNFLLAGYKSMSKLHLRKPEFTYSAFGSFTKHCESIQNFKETGDINYFLKNELHEACFANDPAYSDSKDLAKRIISNKMLKDRAYEIAIVPKYGGYQRRLASIVFDLKKGSRANVNEVLA